MQTIKFKRTPPPTCYSMELSLGDHVRVFNRYPNGGYVIYPNCVFIKVTRKGFNLLNLDTDRTILRRHIYSSKMVGKEYPSRGTITNEFRIPCWMHLAVKKQHKERAS